MTATERMDKVADAAWLRLTARGAMAIFAVIGPLLLREAVVALGKVNDALVQLDKRIDALRGDWVADQRSDAGRFNVIDTRITDLERRIQRIEGIRP